MTKIEEDENAKRLYSVIKQLSELPKPSTPKEEIRNDSQLRTTLKHEIVKKIDLYLNGRLSGQEVSKWALELIGVYHHFIPGGMVEEGDRILRAIGNLMYLDVEEWRRPDKVALQMTRDEIIETLQAENSR